MQNVTQMGHIMKWWPLFVQDHPKKGLGRAQHNHLMHWIYKRNINFFKNKCELKRKTNTSQIKGGGGGGGKVWSMICITLV